MPPCARAGTANDGGRTKAACVIHNSPGRGGRRRRVPTCQLAHCQVRSAKLQKNLHRRAAVVAIGWLLRFKIIEGVNDSLPHLRRPSWGRQFLHISKGTLASARACGGIFVVNHWHGTRERKLDTGRNMVGRSTSVYADVSLLHISLVAGAYMCKARFVSL